MLDRFFLDIRHRILDVAAGLDRIESAQHADLAKNDPRMNSLTKAIAILIDDQPDHTERIQMAFSDAYDPHWQNSK